MAGETAITVQTLVKENGGFKSVDFDWTAADAANNMSFVNSGKERVAIKNDHSSPQVLVFESVADEHGRDGDVSITTTNAKQSITGFFKPHLFNDASGLVIITVADDTSLFVAVFKDPE